MPSALDAPFGIGAPAYPGRNNEHTVTTHFPTWDHVLRFVNREPAIMAGLINMYPRVMPQKHVLQLSAEIVKRSGNEGKACRIFTHPTSAASIIDWASSADRQDNVVPRDAFTIRAFNVGPQRLWVAFFPADAAMKTAMFWINPGVGISTRQAEEALAHIDKLEEVQDLTTSRPLPIDSKAEATYDALRERIVGFVNRAPLTTGNRPTSADVFLFPTGMAAIYRLHTFLLAKFSNPSALFGFQFHSTQHIFEEFAPPDAPFLFLGNADSKDLDILRTYLADLKSQGKRLQALWTEFPSNPNCASPDLHALRQLADEYSFILICDDTVAGTANIDILPLADALVTSLTKSFSGYADVMGGSVTLNPASPFYSTLKSMLQTNYANELYHLDATQLLINSSDYLARSAIHNRNTAALANFFAKLAAEPTPIVTKVFSPLTLPDRANYEAHLRPPTSDFPSPGHGLLLSADFASETAVVAFYDALAVWKSPHLGAHVTLVLPYVKGLYNNELDRVAQWGYRATQLRVAPGLEDEAELLRVFEVAAESAREAVRREGGQAKE